MSRVKWKGPFQSKYILRLADKFSTGIKLKKNWAYKIWSRGSVISAPFMEKSVLIHTGKTFKRMFINRNYLGYKFGEFACTRKFTVKQKKKHGSKK